jgi:hypothetical protein
MKKTDSLPKIHKNSSTFLTDKISTKVSKKFQKTLIKRLYTKDIKKIKLKDNIYWHKTRSDSNLKLQIQKLQDYKSRSGVPKSNKLILKPIIEMNSSDATKKLIKLKEKMNGHIAGQALFNRRNTMKVLNKTTTAELDEDDDDDYKVLDASVLLHEYKNKIYFIDTRIKVLITSLSLLKQQIITIEKAKQNNSFLTKKIQKTFNLLNFYQTSKEKLEKLIFTCKEKLAAEKDFIL